MANYNYIPRATAQRLPIYHHYLQTLQEKGIKRVNSQEISDAIKFDSTTVRRDFSFFGELGRRGYGYEVDKLVDFFSETLNDDKHNQVILAGVGNIGSALVKYNFSSANNLDVVAGFDIEPDSKQNYTNSKGEHIPVYGIDELVEKNKEIKSEVAILTVPEAAAQDVADKLVAAGVRGILNFSPVRISVPKDVRVQHVDLTKEMQTLIYFVDNKDNIKSI